MLDIQFIRDNPEVVKTKSAQKGYDIDVQALLELDRQRRSCRLPRSIAPCDCIGSSTRRAGKCKRIARAAAARSVRLISHLPRRLLEETARNGLQHRCLGPHDLPAPPEPPRRRDARPAGRADLRRAAYP